MGAAGDRELPSKHPRGQYEALDLQRAASASGSPSEIDLCEGFVGSGLDRSLLGMGRYGYAIPGADSSPVRLAHVCRRRAKKLQIRNAYPGL